MKIKCLIFTVAIVFTCQSWADKYDKMVCDSYQDEAGRLSCYKEFGIASDAAREPTVAVNKDAIVEQVTATGDVGSQQKSSLSLFDFIMISALVLYLYIRVFRKPQKDEMKNDGNARANLDKRIEPITVRFLYKDGNGALTERTVDVNHIKSGELFSGYCHLRGRLRTFRFDRIAGDEVINVDTGEVIEQGDWRDNLLGS